MGQVNCCCGSRDDPELMQQRMPVLELPKPLLQQHVRDLLALLQEHGPSTERVFRLAASEHASREIREALDRGVEVQLQSQPVHLLAIILKTQLYQQWMDALQKISRQERLAGLKERQQDDGCQPGHLLSPPEGDTLPLDVLVQVTGKVTLLVQFLIEHHEELFEEEEAGLAGAAAEESPAPQEQTEASEVPPVAPESEHLKSSSGDRRLPDSSLENQKQKSPCEEECDGQPQRKRRKLEREL
ncbi:hypothetical protein AV530_016922 [Patagioenas fasciata monilis]|uniref:Rho-GAP domain-containing protein n=1 Tax=Patagioenas fasciata monilis TaxID=372326 RepID=A0A1V4J421_PATFA|nr:hypothetical protein AV530_016922 [Patagioenas fasciata monilis]